MKLQPSKRAEVQLTYPKPCN